MVSASRAANSLPQVHSSGTSSRRIHSTQSISKAIAQYTEDARLDGEFGGYIQPFDCMIAADERTFRVPGYSQNVRDLMIGTDAREIMVLNPFRFIRRIRASHFMLFCMGIDAGIVIDVEPPRTEDPALSIARAVQSQKLAVCAISQLQALPGGDNKLLCDTVVQTEINYLSQLHHPNLMKLIGYCLGDDHRLLVYEFMRKGSLDKRLFRNEPAGDKSHVSTRVMGTYGYAAPVYMTAVQCLSVDPTFRLNMDEMVRQLEKFHDSTDSGSVALQSV